VTLLVTLWETSPDVAVMVAVVAAGAAAPLAVSVIVLDPAVLVGSKEAVTPAGNPDTVRFIVPRKLPQGITVTLVVALLPCGIDTFVEEAERVKSLGPAFGEGSSSYKGCAGLVSGFSSATEMASCTSRLREGVSRREVFSAWFSTPLKRSSPAGRLASTIST
jgi:hypothetical protein